MTKTVNIYLLRHGKTVGEPALYGRTDIVVDDKVQCQICTQLLEKDWAIQKVVSSPLKRCRHLAERLVEARPELTLEICEDIKEMDFGDLDGMPFDTIGHRWQELEQFWQDPASNTLPNAESLKLFNSRVSVYWEQFVDSVAEDTLIICHGGTIRMILATLLHLDWRSSELYSVLQINHQSISHIQIIKADTTYKRVCSVSAPLS
ncbi:histidine phosphatase family protein [Vibrio japonicus]|uniref:Histidine phosphatase family protein n=1 Tax=Vibrio japonicus TaxID=1824638 RepID=A0ABY5LF33_9VIBR|nr:histidine phosphatase family protein [Vibrio japonicus]UUM29509.1 histidine phosphatase family protein [Vibrio japonicus]